MTSSILLPISTGTELDSAIHMNYVAFLRASMVWGRGGTIFDGPAECEFDGMQICTDIPVGGRSVHECGCGGQGDTAAAAFARF